MFIKLEKKKKVFSLRQYEKWGANEFIPRWRSGLKNKNVINKCNDAF